MKVILETDRLLLREYVEEDAEAFFKLNSDPEVLRFVPDKALVNVGTGPPNIDRSSDRRLPKVRIRPWRLHSQLKQAQRSVRSIMPHCGNLQVGLTLDALAGA